MPSLLLLLSTYREHWTQCSGETTTTALEDSILAHKEPRLDTLLPLEPQPPDYSRGNARGRKRSRGSERTPPSFPSDPLPRSHHVAVRHGIRFFFYPPRVPLQVYEPPRPPAYRPGPPKSVGGSHPTPRAPAPPYGGPTPASYATASTPAGPAFPVQVKVAQPVRGYSQPRRGAQQAYGAPTAPQPPPAGRAEAWEAGYRGRAEPGGKEDRPRGAHPIGAGGGGSYLPKAPPSRPPEEEVERLTKKLVHDMNHPPPSGEYFGRCGGCGEDVVGDGAGVVALDRVFHVGCFVCATCHARLRGQHFYAVERRAFCEDCYLVTLEKCAVCSQPILDRILRAMGKAYHPACFTCVVCHRGLDGVPFTVDATSQIHCIDDFHRKFAPRCSVCAGAIMPEPGQEETVRIVALDRSFHVGCYKCEECGLLLSAEGECQGCYPLDGHILCKACSAWRIQELSATVTTDC
uniref:Thyroid hormone receptor interactor 6 n=1 Tax=Ornithorhynchus anatinus TaxID=9258 RepID=A0A6I8PK04_ORNAN